MYNKASIAMAKIIVEEYKLLQSKLARPLTQRPVIAYKKNKSLKDILYNKASIAMAKIIVEEYKLLQSKLARPLTQRPVIPFKKNKSLKDILHGHIHLCLKELVLEKLGSNAWEKILSKAGSDESTDFMLFHQHSDDLTRRLLNAAVEISGIEMPSLLELYGEFFYHYVARRGYDNMLRTLGDDFVSFLKRLDFLHTLLATTYEGMVPPHFRCEEKDGRIFLHFYSKRGPNMHKIAEGLVREVGIQLFGVQVQTVLLCEESLLAHSKGYKEYALIEIIITSHGDSVFTPVEKPNNSNVSLSVSSLTSRDRFSEVSLAHCSFNRAAPYHIIVDTNLMICGCGRGIKKSIGIDWCLDVKLNTYFTLTEPDINLSYSAILSHIDKPFTLVLKSNSAGNNSVTLRGHFIKMVETENLLYLGSPYFSSLRELANNKVVLTNFPQDDIIRELFFINEKAKVEVQISKQLDSTTAQLQKLSHALEAEKARTDELLSQMLPAKVADQLRAGRPVEAEKFEEATVLFSDIVTFTTIAAECEPMEIVTVLNELFQKFDKLTSVHKVYKVETIGDAYMIVSGVPEVTDEHALRVAHIGLDMIVAAKQVVQPRSARPIQIRVGIHTGPVVAGVVGEIMPRYCLFGDTVNTASRMESHGLPDKVHVSYDTYKRLQGTGIKFKSRGLTNVKGKGKMLTFFLVGHKEKNYTDSEKSPSILNLSITSRKTDARSQFCAII